MENTTYLFVYGSLMKDRYNHGLLNNKDVKYIDNAILEGYSLFDVEGATFPAIIREDGYTVSGEVYEIPKSMIKFLDVFEGVPHLYERKMDIARMGIKGDILVSVYISTPETSIYNRLVRCIRCEHLTDNTKLFRRWTQK